MNILHIITGLGMGGAERVVLDLCVQFKKQNHIVNVIYLSRKDDMINRFHDIGISPIFFDFSRPIFFLKYIIRIISFINNNKISIIHLHLAHPIILSPFIYIFTNARIVFTSHSFIIGGKIRELYTWFFKPFRHCDILFSKSQYKYFYKKRFSIIENGINVKTYYKNTKKRDMFTFLSVARLTKVKNHTFLIDVLNRIIYLHKKNCQLLVAGDGEMRSELEHKIELLNLKSHVQILGKRDDINDLMAESHCFLLPSLWEGLPIVLLEAGASHLPIISNNVGSISSLLNFKNACICPLSDFEKNMLFAIDNYNAISYKAEFLYKKIKEEYSIENIASKHLSLYKSI